MPNINRDRDIIEHILMYINQIGTAHDDFGASKQRFIESTTYQNAISMCILQIGELVNRLSDDFKSNNAHIPWNKIRGMRNYVAHEYGSIDFDIIWYAATHSITDLQFFCKGLLEK